MSDITVDGKSYVDINGDGAISDTEKAQNKLAETLGISPIDEKLVSFLNSHQGDDLAWLVDTQAKLESDPELSNFVTKNLGSFLGQWNGSIDTASDKLDQELLSYLTPELSRSILDMKPEEFGDIFDRIIALLRERGKSENELSHQMRNSQLDLIQSAFHEAMKSASEMRKGAMANLVITCIAAGISLGSAGCGFYALRSGNSVSAQVIAQAMGPIGGTLGQLGPAVQQLYAANSTEHQAVSERQKAIAQVMGEIASAYSELRSGTMSDISKIIEQLTQAFLSVVRVHS